MDVNTFEVEVAKKSREADMVYSFELVHPDGGSLPAFTAGSHLDVYLADGITRQYSVCSDPHDIDRYKIAVLRDPEGRGGSALICDQVAEGQRLKVGGPRNLFPLVRDAKENVLIAGGIGITPILSMMSELSKQERSFELHYAARNKERMAFMRSIEQRFGSQTRFYFDSDPARNLDIGNAVGAPAKNRHLYVCGPGGLINAVLDTAKSQGWIDDCLHWERFSGEGAVLDSDEVFYVEIASTGERVPIEPGESVVEVLEDQGIEIETSCEQGICGTCVTRVLSGIPDHRDYFLSEEEHGRNDCFTPCCSRSKTKVLVLDL